MLIYRLFAGIYVVSNEFLATQFPIYQTKNAESPLRLQRRGHIR